jgi:hypothetical protein
MDTRLRAHARDDGVLSGLSRGQMITGFYDYNETQREEGQPTVTVREYLQTGHPWEATFENWESEFLQMAVFVLLTTFLVQKGSPESRRPGAIELVDADPRDFLNQPDVPWPVSRSKTGRASFSR